MKRKVIKQGNDTLTITLPREWTHKFKVSAGDEVSLEENDNGLFITTDYHRNINTISINIDNLDRLALAKLLIAAYEQGYDTITLNFSKQKLRSWSHGHEDVSTTINFFVSRLIGFEVTSQTPKSITVSNLSETLGKFDNILSRIFFLLEEYLQHLIDSMNSGDYSDLVEGENRHDNITKFIALACRMISEDNSYNKNDAVNYFTVLNYLDKVTDFVRYAYKDTLKYKKKVDKQTVDLAIKTKNYVELYRHFFYKYDYKLVNQLDELRGEVKADYAAIPHKSNEVVINANFNSMVEILHGIIKCRIALELPKIDLSKG